MTTMYVVYVIYSQLSGLEDVVFNDFIKDDFIPEGHGQVALGSASFLTLQPWRQRSRGSKESKGSNERKNERDVLEALGGYKCDAGMQVENVHAVV